VGAELLAARDGQNSQGRGVAVKHNLTAAQSRVMRAARRAAYTRSAIVVLFDADGNEIGHARRRTCDALCRLDLLDEDQSKLGEDGHGDFEFVLKGTK
jgi:hypothetical protein